MQRMGDSSIHFALLVSGNLCDRQGNNQTPSEAPDATCHRSGKQEMDVLHFAAHNICRGNHSTPQRACAAVLKLSIVLAVMSLAFLGNLPGSWELRELRVLKNCLSAWILLVCMVTLAAWVSCLAVKITETWWNGNDVARDWSQNMSEY